MPLTNIFREMLLAIGTPRDQLLHYSMHSWRIYLACALLAAGASTGTIQGLLRWRSDDALKIYARINDAAYSEWLERAAVADVSSVRTSTLRHAMAGPGVVAGDSAAGFQAKWLQRAALADTSSVHPSAVPTHTADDTVLRLQGASSELLAAAERDDGAGAD